MVSFTERPVGNLFLVNNNTARMDIPRDNAMRRMVMRFVINLTTLAGAPTYTQDDILNFIKKIRLVKNGDKNIFNTSARMWWFVEKFEKKTKPYKIDPVTAVSTTADAIFVLMADFARDRTNESDLRALLQPQDFTSLKLEIDCGSNADIASANAPTINLASSYVQVEIKEVLGTVKIGNVEVDVNKIAVDEITELEDNIDLLPNKNQFDTSSIPYNVAPSPANILTHCFMFIDNGVRTDAMVTDLKLQKEKGGRFPIIERKYTGIREETKSEYAQEAIDAGVIYVDNIDKFNGGLILTGNEGDVKYRLLTTGAVTAGLDRVAVFVRSKPLV